VTVKYCFLWGTYNRKKLPYFVEHWRSLSYRNNPLIVSALSQLNKIHFLVPYVWYLSSIRHVLPSANISLKWSVLGFLKMILICCIIAIDVFVADFMTKALALIQINLTCCKSGCSKFSLRLILVFSKRTLTKIIDWNVSVVRWCPKQNDFVIRITEVKGENTFEWHCATNWRSFVRSSNCYVRREDNCDVSEHRPTENKKPS
jgi:hypothetical protein